MSPVRSAAMALASGSRKWVSEPVGACETWPWAGLTPATATATNAPKAATAARALRAPEAPDTVSLESDPDRVMVGSPSPRASSGRPRRFGGGPEHGIARVVTPPGGATWGAVRLPDGSPEEPGF